ncbi:helicase-related protein [Hymenobacter crusticola]|uniref:Helicase n=1 Tax=Hymenobacter crusticola TaxID=1770526 RepID=A0A243W6B0_9BACT|nr:helicase-related protein [Hymenobacter crusticola]OUJ69895.1 helicase [Hymenobacter crusticola]
MTLSILNRLQPNTILGGDLFPEQVHIIMTQPMGESVRIIGRGDSNQLHDRVLSAAQLDQLVFVEQGSYDGNAQKFRLAIEAHRLGLAYEYDPYFSLSIARVDPLPHQLEAVYEYFLKMPCIRFMLADDPGAGKTVMAGLLIKELKARGLAKRILIVTPANLTFQWQREMKDKFRENFDVVRGDVLRANYGSNPWQEKNQVVTSVSWVALQEDANKSLLRATWDLIIVDEAHKMSAQSEDNKTYAYQLGEALSKRTDHMLLMTATPHKGDKKQFQLFLKLLDQDVYADVASLDEAIRQNEAPFYLRRVKEALVTFPDPETGQVKSLFTKREVKTIGFQIDGAEWDFYQGLTRYVEEQSSLAAADDNHARGRAVGFTMAMLQRRFASSLYAVRRSLERMRERREEILKDPEAYRRRQILNRTPDNFDELPDEEQETLLEMLEAAVLAQDPAVLRQDIAALTRLSKQARQLEEQEIGNKLVRLKELLTQQNIFNDPKMKLLIFTEHKDTLDYLVGDGEDGRPLGKLISWGLNTTQIHGGMKVGDRNTPGTRIHAERAFKEEAQVLVATEAAGEGINLQFCWLMVNFDIPWNPIRLEQRMGRIHRYGQEKDCLIFNFVATNTREGRVMTKLFERLSQIENDLDPNHTGKVFNVLGDIFPSNLLEKMLREMYVRNYETEDPILARIVDVTDTARFREITNSTLEGLAKKELNLSAILGKSAEAKERRLVPEVIQDFFLQAAPLQAITVKEARGTAGIFSLGRIPRQLWARGEQNEGRFGVLGHEYGTVAFAKEVVAKDATLDWLTPGHPLFEVVREETVEQFQADLRRGAVFYNLQATEPQKLDVFAASIIDGRGHVLHKRLFVLATSPSTSTITLKQPTIFLDIVPAPAEAAAMVPATHNLPSRAALEQHLVQDALSVFLAEVQADRQREVSVVERHLELSLNELIHKQNLRLIEYQQQEERDGSLPNHLAGLKTQTLNRIQELQNRLDQRRRELARERHCTVASPQHLGTAWVLPHPDRHQPEMQRMVSNADIEQRAVAYVIAHENALGYEVESVESDNRGFDLISRRPHPSDPASALDVKFIEVKGRAGVGEIALSSNEYRTAQRLKQDYYLYVVYDCATPTPQLHIHRDPAHLPWQAVSRVEQYFIKSKDIINAE